MTARPEDPGAWRTDPETSSASGGHLTPGSSGGPLFDPLTAPLPSERAKAEGTYEIETRPLDRLDRRIPEPPEEHRPSRRRRVASRRVRRTIKKVDPLSVLKIAVVYYLIMLVVWLIVVAIIYNMIDASGLFGAMQEAAEGLALDNFEISLGVVEKYAFLIGVASVVTASIATLLGAILYNIAADLLGGVELTFVEREH